MLDLHHDNDSSLLLLRQRSLRRAPNIQHSPQAIANTPTSSSPPLILTPTHNHNHTPPPRKKPTFTLPRTMTDAFRRFQAFRHARSSSASSSSSGPVTPYHKRKHPHVRSHSTPITPESQSQTLIQSSASAPVVTQPTRVLGPTSSSDPQQLQSKNGTVIDGAVDVPVPPLLREGTQMTKVTNKKRKKVMVRLDPDMGQIIWEVMQPGVVGRQRISACLSFFLSFPLSPLLLLRG